MAGFRTPPPGSIPSGVGSPDMQGALEDVVANSQGQTKSAGSNSPANNAISSALQGKQSSTKTARPIGSPLQEAKYLAQDIGQSFVDLLPGPLKNMLSPVSTDSLEEAAKKKAMLQRYQQLNADQQKFVQQKMQQEAAVKHQKEEEAARQKQLAAQQKPAMDVPQGKVRGDAQGKKSSKSQTINKLQDDRKKLKDSAM